MTTLQAYLRSRLLILGLLLIAPIMYLVFSLYQLGLDDATELYLHQDLDWVLAELKSTDSLPEPQPHKLFVLGTENLPKIYEEIASSLPEEPYLYLENQNSIHYGITSWWNEERLYVIHIFPVEESVEGIQLESIVFISVLLILLVMMIGALLVYRRIALAMSSLESVASHDGHWSDIEVDLFEFSEVYEIAHALKFAIEQLEIKNQQERMFIQSLSHELRTPMAIIQLAIEVLNKKEIDHMVRAKLDTIFSANQKMQTLSNQLLALWQSQDMGSKQTMSVNQEIKEAIQDLNEQYGCGERFVIDAQGQEQVLIRPNSTLAAQLVITNLLKNAVIHGEGVIEVKIAEDGFSISNAKCIDINQEDDMVIESVGMGLVIVEKAVQSLSWRMSVSKNGQYEVDIQF